MEFLLQIYLKVYFYAKFPALNHQYMHYNHNENKLNHDMLRFLNLIIYVFLPSFLLLISTPDYM